MRRNGTTSHPQHMIHEGYWHGIRSFREHNVASGIILCNMRVLVLAKCLLCAWNSRHGACTVPAFI